MKRMGERKLYGIGMALVAFSLLVTGYLFLSDYLAKRLHEKEIQAYSQRIEETQAEEKKIDFSEEWNRVDAYNQRLTEKGDHIDFVNGESEDAEYLSLLDIQNGMMGYLSIPAIHVKLPVYHGTGEDVLASGIGHLEGSSLPEGGKGNHCILSGHSGMAARLFTDLSELAVGDTFSLTILDRTMVYEVDQIKTVIPSNTEDFVFDKEEDYVTLFTCTPIGINSHRLLVRGKRTETEEGKEVEG